MQFGAIERNTGQVSLASVLCTATAANPEIAALTQHRYCFEPWLPVPHVSLLVSICQLCVQYHF